MAYRKIVLKSAANIAEEAFAAAALNPGHLVALASTGKVAKHATEGGRGERLFAKESVLQGRGIDTAYAQDELVFLHVGQPGDEINAYEQKVWFTIGDEKGGLVVMMFYGSSGCWATSIGQIGEDVPIPWEVRVGAEGHSVVVCVDCPDGTPAKVTRESTS